MVEGASMCKADTDISQSSFKSRAEYITHEADRFNLNRFILNAVCNGFMMHFFKNRLMESELYEIRILSSVLLWLDINIRQMEIFSPLLQED